ncbi:MAG: 30S ribosomal protein S20 [Ignavibacteriales bacterium]|nr:30S ribosomal protein S20 [Ignavibacteriales bacterium]
MAQHKSAQKRIRSTARRAKKNTEQQSAMKTMIKKVRSITDKKTAEAVLKETVSLLDKLAGKRVIHPNKASNQKSKLTRIVNALK